MQLNATGLAPTSFANHVAVISFKLKVLFRAQVVSHALKGRETASFSASNSATDLYGPYRYGNRRCSTSSKGSSKSSTMIKTSLKITRARNYKVNASILRIYNIQIPIVSELSG